ncbi:19193_t:CDS:1 [Gigaspora margarita]|uniref:19193_t:CDS:1 n=1 Tax=Gigaspora margarita TaxID=4874 RepID=A0ABN7UKW3_GIGMA|nr:19193_t:CDS:1 [Gigaspora margarita]
MTTAYLKIMTDLSETHPEDVIVPLVLYDLYDTMMTIEDRVDITFQALLKSTRQRKKQNYLVYAFYLGQLLEVFTKLLAERTMLKSCLTKYYALAVTHTYYIFERWGMEQIMQTSKLAYEQLLI